MTVRRAAAALVLVALAAVAAAAPEASRDPLEPLKPDIARQDQLVERKQYDTLLAESKARAEKEGTPEALYLRGRALGNLALIRRREGREDEFGRLLEESQRAFEDAKEAGVVVFAPAYLGLARCARYRGDARGAVQQLEQALRLAPAFKAAGMELGMVLAEVNRPKDAEIVVRNQLAQHPNDPELRVLLGMIKVGANALGEAEREFRAAVAADPSHAAARKLLATALLTQRQFPEAAEHLETYRRLQPQDDEAYRFLFTARMKSKDREGAVRALDEMRKALPGTEHATWAERMTAEYTADPAAFEAADERTPEGIVDRLRRATDPREKVRALGDARAFRWPALPEAVYDMIAPKEAPEVRREAVRVIAWHRDPQTLRLLELLLFHPQERDPDAGVRREAAAGVASLETIAAVPILFRALDDADVEVREAAVRGIAARTGKSFREKLDAVPDPSAWTEERRLYDAWWNASASGSVVKRDAMADLQKLTSSMKRGRRRLGEYAFQALDDADPRTWRAGYDLFRTLTGQDFGTPAGDAAAERVRITRECRVWFAAHGQAD